MKNVLGKTTITLRLEFNLPILKVH